VFDRDRLLEGVGLGDVRLDLDADPSRKCGRFGVEDDVHEPELLLHGLDLEPDVGGQFA
jgi:hypothetical protein